MTDLTKITTPFGLLDTETQEALRAHGGPYEVFAVNAGVGWQPGDEWGNDMLETFPALAWRVKPQPPKPKEWWVKFDPVSEMFFQRTTQPPESAGYTLVREVLSDD